MLNLDTRKGLSYCGGLTGANYLENASAQIWDIHVGIVSQLMYLART